MIEYRGRFRFATLLSLSLLLAVQACGSSGDDTTTPKPAITIALSPTSASVVQGGSTTVTATVTATGGFTGTPTATVTGAPTGVTILPTNVQTSGATTTVTVQLSVASTVAAGTYTLTVTGSGTGVTAVTATFTLTVTAAPASSYTLSLNPTSLSVTQGGNGTVTVNLTRTNFTAGVTLAAEGLPAGVTAAFNTSPTTGNTSTLTLTASASATTGTSNVTIRGTATGATDQTATLALTVAAASTGSYTLSATPASVSVTQGASGTSTINVNRTGGFAGSVALAVTGAPTGVTATLNPTSTTGNSSTLTIAASATATTGPATLTITGTATGLANQTTTIALTVATSGGGGSGNVTLDYSACAAASKPIWVAAQDGSGAWTRVTPTNDVYKFNVTSGKGGYAVTTASGATNSTTVNFFTQAEITSAPIVFCTSSAGTRSVTGTVAGLGQTDAAFVSMGGSLATVTAASLNFTLNNMLTGQQDLVAYRTNFLAGPSTNDRAVIMRDLNPASGGSVGTVDFGASSAITPASGTITVTGGASGDQYFHSMSYLTGAACTTAILYSSSIGTSASLSAFGIPAASQRATDFHQVFVTDATGTTATRSVFATFHTFASQSIALGAALPTPTITVLSAAYKRLQAVVTLPSDYQTSASLTYSAASKSGSVLASFGYLGSANATLAFPDFTGVSGFDATWLPPSSATVSTTLAVSGSSIPITSPTFTFCNEGLKFKIATVSGSF